MTVLRVCYKHGVRFDESYYVTTHARLTATVMGAHGVKSMEMVKVSGAADGSAPLYQVIFSAYFDSAAALDGLMHDPKMGDVLGDIKNFYDGMPDTLVGDVVQLPGKD